MPNWCYNYATFSHKDPAQVARLAKAVAEENLLNEFVPCPQELKDATADHTDRPELIEKYGYSSWYDFSCGEWGTKWDVGNADTNEATEEFVSFSFDTAWAPPVAFYDKMVEMGWEIDADYTEEGMGFVGYYTNEDGDEYFELNFDEFDEKWRDNFPERLHERVEYQYADWLECQENASDNDDN